MAKETAAQRKTRIAMLLADYDDKSRQLRKLAKDVDDLKAQLREIDPGTYGDWTLATGTPREILDQAAAKQTLTANGLEIPTTMTTPPMIVRPK